MNRSVPIYPLFPELTRCHAPPPLLFGGPIWATTTFIHAVAMEFDAFNVDRRLRVELLELHRELNRELSTPRLRDGFWEQHHSEPYEQWRQRIHQEAWATFSDGPPPPLQAEMSPEEARERAAAIMERVHELHQHAFAGRRRPSVLVYFIRRWLSHWRQARYNRRLERWMAEPSAESARRRAKIRPLIAQLREHRDDPEFVTRLNELCAEHTRFLKEQLLPLQGQWETVHFLGTPPRR